MATFISRLPISLDPLIAEAKRRTRRRRLLIVGLLALVAAGTTAGVLASRSPASPYVPMAWTRGHFVQMRNCPQAQAGPSLAGAALSASAGVTCQTAIQVMNAVKGSCYSHSPCEAASFLCRAYWSGRFWSSFSDTNHALCSEGSKRVIWDGG